MVFGSQSREGVSADHNLLRVKIEGGPDCVYFPPVEGGSRNLQMELEGEWVLRIGEDDEGCKFLEKEWGQSAFWRLQDCGKRLVMESSNGSLEATRGSQDDQNQERVRRIREELQRVLSTTEQCREWWVD